VGRNEEDPSTCVNLPFLGPLVALIWGVIGTVTGDHLWNLLLMFVAVFAATVLKNPGDRASGLATCMSLLFIICNAYP
jgi:hypothetical protein